jgi:hypothetical protein
MNKPKNKTIGHIRKDQFGEMYVEEKQQAGERTQPPYVTAGTLYQAEKARDTYRLQRDELLAFIRKIDAMVKRHVPSTHLWNFCVLNVHDAIANAEVKQ